MLDLKIDKLYDSVKIEKEYFVLIRQLFRCIPPFSNSGNAQLPPHA